MKFKLQFVFLSLLGLLIFSSCDDSDSKEEQAIRGQSKAYEQAFNQGNAKAIAKLWAEDAIFIEPESGLHLEGRSEIEKDFAELFQEESNPQIEIQVKSIEITAKNKAVETGSVQISRLGEDPTQTVYKAYYEKIDQDWLLTEVREFEYEPPTSHYEHLKELEWLVGEWVDEDEDTKIVTNISWSDNRNYLTQYFTVTAEGQNIQEGKQIIAWDPSTRTIRSWIFDSDGGFGEGIWSREKDKWSVETSFTLPDGRRASAVNSYIKDGAERYTWESTNREVAGELLPSIGPVNVEKMTK
ncbi:MAG: SgcJ/EcaC family oxidoreductase [Chlamydiota bacterium]